MKALAATLLAASSVVATPPCHIGWEVDTGEAIIEASPTELAEDPSTGEPVPLVCKQAWRCAPYPGETTLLCETVEVCSVVGWGD